MALRSSNPTTVPKASVRAAVSGRLLSLLLLAAPLVACKPGGQQLSYESLCGLAIEQIGSMTTDQLQRWMEEEHGAAREVLLDQFPPAASDPLLAAFGWLDEGAASGTAWLRDGVLFRLEITDIENGPSFEEAVEAFGPPQVVSASGTTIYDPVLFVLRLDYPSLGLSLESVDSESRSRLTHAGVLAAPLPEGARVTDVECYAPGTLEDTLARAFFISSPEAMKVQLERRIPWLGFGSLIPLEEKLE
jgi:hypothetical protein